MRPMIEVERLSGTGSPVIVLLHAGVADRRSWREVAPMIHGAVHAYDRRGFGDTPPSADGAFTHLGDLLEVLEGLGTGPVWLVGNSMGGALAIDAALTAPERVAGLVLIAPAVSGAPDPGELDDPATARLAERMEAAAKAGDRDAVNRLETWLWLDGPAGPEGRVAGRARELALAMNAVALANSDGEDSGESGLDAWSRLEEIRVPTTVVWGDLDIPALCTQYAQAAGRIPGARTHVLHGVAHLPSLERPAELAAAVNAALA
jgi:pimeloyl-ACP methyl ester carboxylesterase